VVSTRPVRPWIAVSLGLILGGALGNLADRVANGPGFSGRVTDFIDLQVWPIFNLADTAIVLGAAILAVASFDGTDDHVEPSGASGPAATGSGGSEP
jgi:signal peptidase II